MKHPVLRHILTATVAAIILATVVPSAGIAQNESGTRSLNKPAFGGLWYDSTTAMYQYSFPIIRNLPPLNSAMPWDVMAGYIVADSIARFDNTYGQATEGWLNSRHSIPDTLAGLFQFLYRMKEYDAITFAQYKNEVDLKRNSPIRPYKASLRSITSAAQNALLRCAPDRSEAGALYSALYADYVLHIKVLAIDSMPLKPHPGVGVQTVFRATVEILDTLKGGIIPSCQQEFGQDRYHKNPHVASSAPCTYVMYNRLSVWDPEDQPDQFRKIYYARDSAFCTEDSSFSMYIGQEAVVFLAYGDQKLDSTHDYFDLNISAFASFGALPVVEGRVRDVNHIWSNELWMNYPDWRQRFLAIREKIITRNY